jgi:acetyltransferase-like isoleucine patch superfamily enzyme
MRQVRAYAASSRLRSKFAPTPQWCYALVGAYVRVGANASLTGGVVIETASKFLGHFNADIQHFNTQSNCTTIARGRV